jgi:hypothetical protein
MIGRRQFLRPMDLSTYEGKILQTLRETPRSKLRNESAARNAIEISAAFAAEAPFSAALETLAFSQALIHAEQTGSTASFGEPI